MSVGAGLFATGLALPWSSYFDKQAKRGEYERQQAKFTEQRTQLVARLGAGQIRRPENDRQMEAIMAAESAFSQREAPHVNQAIDLHQRRRQQGLWLAAVGLAVFLLAWKLTQAPRPGAFDEARFDEHASAL